MIKFFLLSFSIILFITGCTQNKSDYVTERAEILLDSGVAPIGNKVIIFSGDKINTYLVRGLTEDVIKSKKQLMEKLLGNNTARTSEISGVCTIIINPNKAFAKYKKRNIDLLLAHEIGHCYGSILNLACSEGDCLNASDSYTQYIIESFADFMGMYKLAEKTGRFDSFEEKISLNENWQKTQYNYKNNTKTIRLAKKYFNSEEQYTDLQLAKLFISDICSNAEILANKCITSH